MKFIRIIFIVITLLYTAAQAVYAQPVYTPPPDTSAKHVIDSTGRSREGLQQTDTLPGLQISLTDTARPGIGNTGYYIIKGKVEDINTAEGISFATIFFPDSPSGTTADLNGNFTLHVKYLPGDTLQITALGYDKYKKVIDRNKHQYEMVISLKRSSSQLNEFVFHAGEDPALLLLKNIISHKHRNDPSQLINYKYRVYNKLELDLQHLSKEQFKKLPLMKHFSFIYDNQDTDASGKPFLPIFLVETLSDFYYQYLPKKQREHIIASEIRGVKNDDVTKYMGATYLEENVYNNYMLIFGKQFVSPISESGAFFYRYKIKDTEEAYGHRIILMEFEPKRAGEPCFYGSMWVVDSMFALQSISLEVPKTANVDWVNSLSLHQEYAPVKNSFWFCVKDKIVLDAAGPYGLKVPSFIGKKTSVYKDIAINDPSVSDSLDKPDWRSDVVIDDSARKISDAEWATLRPDSLSKNEKAIYKMIDTFNNSPDIIFYKNLVKFLVTGKVDVGYIQFGPYWYLFSRNTIEGRRIRISLGTSDKFSKDVHLSGYIAYGNLDKLFKYNISGLWLLSHKPRTYISGSYTEDIDHSNNFYDKATSDNVVSNLLRKPGVPWKLAFVKEARLDFFKEYFNGFSYKIAFWHRDFKPYVPLPVTGIFYDNEGVPADHIINTEANVLLRYAYKERFIDGNYTRISLGSKYPIIELRLGEGFKNIWNSGYDYKKVRFNISNKLKIAPIGSLYYNLFAGKYFGTLPYPLLEIHPGNEQYYYNPHAFELMNKYEFLSSQYAGFHIEHNIGGGVFNYIPYIKKLKLRQFWTAKGVWGDLSAGDRALNLDKGYPFQTLKSHPYLELGTGIENIFELFRIDFVWRVLPRPIPLDPKPGYFGTFVSVKFVF